MKDDDSLFFVNRKDYSGRPLNETNFKWPRYDPRYDDRMGGPRVHIPIEAFDQLKREHVTMAEFIKVALPHMGLVIPEGVPVTEALVKDLTIRIKAHDQKEKK
jgi:hypothetical protein